MPLVARSIAQLLLIPLGAPAMLAVFIVILRRSGTSTQPAALLPHRGKIKADVEDPEISNAEITNAMTSPR